MIICNWRDLIGEGVPLNDRHGRTERPGENCYTGRRCRNWPASYRERMSWRC